MMQRFFSFVLVFWALLVLLGGCADDGVYNNEVGVTNEAHSLTIWNRSQFPIDSLQLVSVPALQVDGEVVAQPVDELDVWSDSEPALELEQTFTIPQFVSGSRVAFTRERAAGARPILVESIEGFAIDQEGYTLVLFDDSFRLLYPWSEDNPYGAARQ